MSGWFLRQQQRFLVQLVDVVALQYICRSFPFPSKKSPC